MLAKFPHIHKEQEFCLYKIKLMCRKSLDFFANGFIAGKLLHICRVLKYVYIYLYIFIYIYIYLYIFIYIFIYIYIYLYEKSVGTTELHYSTKKREHCFSILKAYFVRHSSEYGTSDSDRKVKRSI